MRTPFAFAALAAMLALPAVPAQAGPADYVGTTCGFAGTYDELAGVFRVRGVMSGAVTASDSTANVEITCVVRVNIEEPLFVADSVPVGPSAVVAFNGDNTWPVDLSDRFVDLCTTIAVDGVTVHDNCRGIVRTPVVPEQVCDLITFECRDEEEWHLAPEPVSS